MSSHLLALIESSFGSLSQLKSSMSAATLGMMSSGWIWLVCDENASHLAFVATYGPGTMLVRSRQHRHPEGLSPNYGIGPGGLNTGKMFKVLGEKEQSIDGMMKSEERGSFGKTPLRSFPGTRNFHHAATAMALQQSVSTQARFSQLPLGWRTALEPLSIANRRPGASRAVQYSSTSGEELDELDESLPPAEPLSEPPIQPIISSSAINATMNHRSNPAWDVNRWKGNGDDLSPLMCIRFVFPAEVSGFQLTYSN